MRPYKLFWDTHKWTGIVLSLPFVLISVTGLLLLIKKRADWIQPPTQKGESGGLEEYVTLQDVFATVFAAGHEDFQTMDDIDRIDFRPGKRVHKVRSVHNHSEVQVDAINGAVLSIDTRNSDFLEQLHDGSWFGNWVHEWPWLLLPSGILFLVGSGLYIWLGPILSKRRRRKQGEATTSAAPPRSTPLVKNG